MHKPSNNNLMRIFLKLLREPQYLIKFARAFKNHAYNLNALKNEIYIFANKPKNATDQTQEYNDYPTNNTILVVSHELTNTGAPKALYLLAQALIAAKYNLILCSPTDGPMRTDFEALNIPVIIDKYILIEGHATAFVNFAKKCDLIILNTILCAPAVKALGDKVKTLWWLHESATIHEFFKNTRLAAYKDTLIKAKNLYTVSEYAKHYIDKYNPNAHVIELGIPDQGINIHKTPKSKQDPIVFTMIGAITHKKGFDILIETIKKLPKEYQDKATFNLIGGINDQKFFKQLNKTMHTLDCIHYHGAISAAEVLTTLGQSDVLLCLSRDDSFPMVTIEAWMSGVPCILAKTVGTSKYIEEGKNGFIIDSENKSQLAELICKIIDHRELLVALNQHARQTFINKFSIDKFTKRWQQEIKKILAQ